ncbi:MAG: 6-pyruvoyl-tetrahydropterin synthase-related protein [Candidatus Microgenomates bacterium]
MKKLILFFCLIFTIFFLGKDLLPTNNYFFTFHDETQPARIQQFVINLKNLQIPPRIAPNFSFNLGYPVFNYYAPTSYWITSFFHLIGFDVLTSLKISFLLSILVAFISFYLFSSLFFGFYQSIFASLLYASSPWIAVEIFVRGNLAEMWFLSLLPLVFWSLYKNSKIQSRKFFVLTIIILGASLTTHNVLSFTLLPLTILFILILKNKQKNILALILALLLNSYFFIPAILEINQTWATTIAKHTDYASHLLCLWQLWKAPFWGYGGSGPDCINDGMSFMLGKPQIIFSSIGFLFLIYLIYKKNKNRIISLYFILLTFTFIYLTTYLSYPLSKLLNNYLGFFQFPWRFLVFILFGISFFSAAIKSPKKINFLKFLLVILGLFVVFYNAKFFTKDKIQDLKLKDDLLKKEYISDMVAYKVAEYLPKIVDYQTWLKHEPKKQEKYLIDNKLNDGFFVHYLDKNETTPIILENNYFYKKAKIDKNEKIIINISYMPYWKILINEKEFFPNKFDKLGRPIIKVHKNSLLVVKYEQTQIEKISNIISLLTFFSLVFILKKSKPVL